MRWTAYRYVVLAAALALISACGSAVSSSPTAGGGASTNTSTTLRVGVSPVPHGDILRFVKDNLAAREGLDLEIVEFTDYVQPNLALGDRQIDANFFQHVPYMEDFAAEHKIDMVAVAEVHIEPLGIYSRKVTSLADVPDQAVVAIPNDTTNSGRALRLLAANGLITLNENAGVAATVRDITGNPKQLQITELEAAQLPRSLDDTTLSVINGNYALGIGLKPNTDALALEQAADNPYANVLTVLRDREDDPAVQKLARLLVSAEVKQFIEQQYQGTVIAVP